MTPELSNKASNLMSDIMVAYRALDTHLVEMTKESGLDPLAIIVAFHALSEVGMKTIDETQPTIAPILRMTSKVIAIKGFAASVSKEG